MLPLQDTTGLPMSSEPIVQTISSGSEQRMNIPIVTVESFFENHAKGLQLKLEGERIGFERRIREPTINRPGLALAGFYTYFAEKRIQVLGAAEQSYLKSLTEAAAARAFSRAVPAKNPLPRDFPRIPSQPGSARHRGRGRDRGFPHPDDHDEVHQRGHDRARVRFFADR